ncbi:hypothetical protein NE237_020052 [Protea cynaroides]|uniref:Uncharacterized protein n=1 Tax=Protea cynaroides TaxID=273540 RepID=A0A9Q0H5B2_9MAGN|nr:hypothetical protein NE237_020052 [Protea cynaroides]
MVLGVNHFVYGDGSSQLGVRLGLSFSTATAIAVVGLQFPSGISLSQQGYMEPRFTAIDPSMRGLEDHRDPNQPSRDQGVNEEYGKASIVTVAMPTLVGSRLDLGKFLGFPFDKTARPSFGMQLDCVHDSMGVVPAGKLNNRHARKLKRLANRKGKDPLANAQNGKNGAKLGIPSAASVLNPTMTLVGTRSFATITTGLPNLSALLDPMVQEGSRMLSFLKNRMTNNLKSIN